MGKRSNFERNERDYYVTPYKAVIPLIPFLKRYSTFIEPCAGDGRLINHLEKNSLYCSQSFDIEPQSDKVEKDDVFNANYVKADYIITNPPWDRKILHPMIEKFVDIDIPTWLLFDADWAYNVSSSKYLKHVAKIVAIGRVKWIEESKYSGKDNCCWYLFDKNDGTKFYGRS